MIGIVMMRLWTIPPKAIDAPPAYHIASSNLAGLPVSGHVIASSRAGRIELRQYGSLNNRGIDMAIALVLPPKGIGMGTQFVQDLVDVNLLRLTRAVMTNQHHDLDTRFGEFRATEMRVNADGRWKLCLSFRSRLETPTIYLTGWYCDGTGSKPSPNLLACTLDRLVLDHELSSKDADEFLRARLARSAYCTAQPVSQTTDTRLRTTLSPTRFLPPYRRY